MQCEVLIDWLTFTVKGLEPEMVIRDYLGMDPDLFQETGLSLMGYQCVKVFSDIRICSQPRENEYFHNMGVCVSMSGNGCRTFETFSRLAGASDRESGESAVFLALFQKLVSDQDAHVTRLDVACDERDGALDMEKIMQCVNGGAVNSRLSRRTVEYEMNGSQRGGATVYIGAPSSDYRIRIYDKAAEQGVAGPWIRVEQVMRGKHASSFVHHLMEGESGGASVGKLAAQVLNDKLSFIIRDDTNISRCSVCAWWSSFVDELEKVRLVARCVIQHTVDQLASWISSQIAPTLYIIGHTIGFWKLYEYAEEAAGRLSWRQEALIVDWNSMVSARSASQVTVAV